MSNSDQAARTSAGIHKVSQPDIERIEFPLPPVETQRAIIQKVSELFSRADTIEQRTSPPSNGLKS